MKIIYPLIFILVLILSACNRKDEKSDPSVTIQKIPFTPPKDTSISKEQFQKWLHCTVLLDSLSYKYSDSFKTEDPKKQLEYQERFIRAQDTLCIEQGLLGGYYEYLWVHRHLGLKKNSYLLDSTDNSRFLK